MTKRKYHVLIMNNCFKGEAAGENCYQLACEMVAEGHRVTVLLPQGVDKKSYETMSGIQVKRFDYFWPRRWSKVAYGLGIPENLRTSWMARLQFPLYVGAYTLRAIHEARKADAVIAITTIPLLGGVAAQVLLNKPLIFNSIGSDIRTGPKWMRRRLIVLPDHVACATDMIRGIVRMLGRTENVHDIKHMIDFDRFHTPPEVRRETRAELGVEEDDFVFTLIARLYPFKDPLTFVRAAGLVKDALPHAKFLMVGSGRLEEQCQTLGKELGLEGRLIMTGYRVDVERMLAASDVFCALSPFNNCFVNTILESISAGVPCILTDAGHTAQYFTHNQYAVLVPVNDPDALAAAFVRMAADSDLRRALANRGPELLRKLGFDRKLIVQQYLDLIEASAEAGSKRSFFDNIRRFFAALGGVR